MKSAKPYKAATPETTVNRIKSILNESHLPIKETKLGDDNMFFSCRISITRDNDTSIGTNGKGMNREYAMASGYAEFLERFQNRVIVYPNPASALSPYRFFPDETDYHWKTRKEIIGNVRKFTPSVMPEEGIEVDELEGKLLPFYHLNSGKVENIPYSLIRWVNGSNGMSAGNILEESLIQGFCEIFERHALQQMYIRGVVPPDIPPSEFNGTKILQRLEAMKADYGMDFVIKDLSLGEGFPVIGLLVYSADRCKYILQLGADLNPVIALERCFTEIFQGYTANTLCFENDVNQCERVDLFNEFKRSLTYGRGRLPRSFFTEKPSYAHNGHTTIPEGHNFRDDLSNVCQWVMDKGYDIYLRDNSFLGFCTTHIVIPGLSDIDHRFCRLNRRIFHMNLIENNINPLFNLRSLDVAQCKRAALYLESLSDRAVNLFARNNNAANHVNRNLLLMMLNLKIGNHIKVKEKIEDYICECKSSSAPIRPFAVALLHLLGGESNIKINDNAMRKAKMLLHNNEDLFSFMPVPMCFNCDECPIAEGCRYPLIKEIEEFTQRAMAKYSFNQKVFAQLFA